MRFVPSWVPMFSWWAYGEKSILKKFKWNDKGGTKASKPASLMIYMALCFFSYDTEEFDYKEDIIPNKGSELTYTQLSELTGLSRKLISDGLSFLVNAGMIEIIKNGNKNIYLLLNKSEKRGGFCKLPVKGVLSTKRDKIVNFQGFSLRKKVSLHALKVFYYLLASRKNNLDYTAAS